MKRIVLLSVLLLLILGSCPESKKTESNKGASLSRKALRIAVVTDTQEEFAVGTREGFKQTMDKLLQQEGATATYEVYDTELSEAKAASILVSLKASKPDLVVSINYPTAFADAQISLKLPQSFSIISENCIPVQSGVAKSWEAPGGNITGVGVFIQFNSSIKLAKRLVPSITKVAVYSWDAMTQINEWLQNDIQKACKEENVELLEFRKVPYQEAEIEFYRQYADQFQTTLILTGISAFVKKDGSNTAARETIQWAAKNTKLLNISYDEIDTKDGFLAGTCVIWADLGAQLAEKGLRVLKGEKPANIPWSYPRKYNLIFNLKRASDMGLKIPQDLISGAYRAYKDYDGNFAGKGK